MAAWLHQICKDQKFTIKRLRGDNAGENKTFLSTINNQHWQLGVAAEWTPRDTPQPNRIENPLYVVTMRARALLASANVPDVDKNILFPHAYNYAWQTRGLEIVAVNGKEFARYQLLTGKLPKWLKYM